MRGRESQVKKLFLRTIFQSSDALVMLQMDISVQAQAILNFGDRVGSALEGVLDVVTGLKVAGIVGELTAAKRVGFFNFGAFGFEFFGNGGDEVVNAAFE